MLVLFFYFVQYSSRGGYKGFVQLEKCAGVSFDLLSYWMDFHLIFFRLLYVKLRDSDVCVFQTLVIWNFKLLCSLLLHTFLRVKIRCPTFNLLANYGIKISDDYKQFVAQYIVISSPTSPMNLFIYIGYCKNCHQESSFTTVALMNTKTEARFLLTTVLQKL